MKTASRIPAGLTDLNIEIYLTDGRIEFIKEGKVHQFTDLLTSELGMIRFEIEQRPEAVTALEEMNITDPVEQIRQWITCNLGDFDARADISTDGIIIREYWDCGRRGTCPHEGRLCSLPQGANGSLTPREIQIIKLVASDLPDKLIADRLNISTNTVCVHRSHIEHKIGAHSKAGITAFAYEHNIL